MKDVDTFLENFWMGRLYGAATRYREENRIMQEDQREHLRYSGLTYEQAVTVLNSATCKYNEERGFVWTLPHLGQETFDRHAADIAELQRMTEKKP